MLTQNISDRLHWMSILAELGKLQKSSGKTDKKKKAGPCLNLHLEESWWHCNSCKLMICLQQSTCSHGLFDKGKSWKKLKREILNPHTVQIGLVLNKDWDPWGKTQWSLEAKSLTAASATSAASAHFLLPCSLLWWLMDTEFFHSFV